jgi:hypothetical protein
MAAFPAGRKEMIGTVVDFNLKEAWATLMDSQGQTDSHVDVRISFFISIELT